MTKPPAEPKRSEIILYQTEDGKTRLQVRLENETVWLTQKMMAELFQKDIRTISEHIRNILDEGELQADSVIRKFRITAEDGKSYETNHYNLDVIISVGYRVKSHRGTQFRIWATQRLREYIIKGFALDDERFKQAGGGNYFDELLARIRDIRSSEKVFWRKVLEIYATSIDYDPNTDLSREFFAVVQNKMHWAAHGHTAPEIVHHRAEAELDAAVRALIHRAVRLSSAVAPEDHLLAHARHADGFVLNFVRFEQDVPLIANHENLLLKSKHRLSNERYSAAKTGAAFFWFSVATIG